MFQFQYWMILIMTVHSSRMFSFYLSVSELFDVIHSVINKHGAADSSWWSEFWYELLICYEMLRWTFFFFQNISIWFGCFGSWLYSHLQTVIMIVLTVLMLSLDQWRLLGSMPWRFRVLFKHWDERYSVIQNVQGSIPTLPLVLKLSAICTVDFFHVHTVHLW
jgi:hypothetical protein